MSDSQEAWQSAVYCDVPDAVKSLIKKNGIPLAQCLACMHSNTRADGSFGECWLAFSRDRGLCIEQDSQGQTELRWEADTADIDSVVCRGTTGGGILVCRVKGVPVDVIGYSAGDGSVFGEFAGIMTRFLKKPEPDRQDTAETAKPHAEERDIGDVLSEFIQKQKELRCPKCGRVLPRDSRVCKRCVPRRSVLLRIFTFAKPFRSQLFLMGVLMVVGMLLHLIPPQLLRFMIDNVLANPEEYGGWLVPIVAAMGLQMLILAGVQIIRGRLGIRIGVLVTTNIQRKVFSHLQTLSLSYFNKQQTGAIMSRVNNDTRQMQHFLADGIQFTVVNILLLIGVAAVLLWMDPFLGLLVLIPAPFVGLFSKFTFRRVIRRFRLAWEMVSDMSAYLNDALSGIRIIKAFGQEPVEVDRFNRKVERVCNSRIRAESTWMTLIPILSVVMQSSTLLIWYFGAHKIFKKEVTIGELMAFIGYMGMIYGPFRLLTQLNDWLTRSMTSAARIFEILDTEPNVVNVKNPTRLPEARLGIEVDNVVFGYEPHKPVIKDISMEVRPGEMVGFVGHSGAGKSTMINLIGRLYDVEEGAIRIGGVDVRNIEIHELRSRIGYVLQETFLFNGSVRDNIAYASMDASQEAIINAAVAANAHEFIMKLSDGYDTIVGERGAKLSGGERQRVAIARAILHNPDILILDEATSAVDTETESKIQTALKKLIEGRTTIAIAHRLSTLRHADRLIVMKDGEIAEQGSHEQLMEIEDGIYQKLVNIQSEWSRTIAVK